MKPFLQGLRPVLHIAHRGGAGLAPENTLPAFRQAVETFRTDILELDVHLTREGEVVVFHDPTVERITEGHGAISSLTLAEVQSLDAAYRFTPFGGTGTPLRGQGIGIPTLREVLRAFPEVRLNVELKDPRSGGEQVLAQLLNSEGALERVCLGSEQDELADRLHRVLPDACHFYPREALANFVLTVKSGGPPPADDRFSLLAMPVYFQGMRLIDVALLGAVHQAGKFLAVWTVDDPEEMRRLILEGVGGIMTDRPDLLREAINLYSRPR
ncbi:MAG: glycerophosphodiester phosphodiesterase [Myxococcota bacterium]|nr:glycerophosphodiester phosphodiesterase [Myxococcota bacterium]